MSATFKIAVPCHATPGVTRFAARSAGVLVASVLLATGCARFEPKPLNPNDTAERLQSRSLTDPGLKQFLDKHLAAPVEPWPVSAWDFDMLVLASGYFHPSLELARTQWALARAGETTAAQRPNPTLNAVPGYDTTTSVPSPWIPSVTLDVPIETAGKRRYRREHAAWVAEAARLNVATAAWILRGSLRSSLADLQAAQHREVLLKQQLALQEQSLRLVEGQVAAGALAGAESLTYRVALQKSRLDLADAQRSRVDAQARLAESMGLPVEQVRSAKLAFDWFELLSSSSFLDLTNEQAWAGARRQALTQRADLLSLLAEYAAAQSALRLEIARQYPDVRLSPGYQYDQGDNKWALGLSLELPVLHQNQGAIAEARARRDEAAAKFNAAQAKVLFELERAIEALRLSRSNVDGLRVLARDEARRRDSVAAQVRAGAAAPLDLLSAQAQFAAAELARFEGEARVLQAMGALEDALQQPIVGKLTPVTGAEKAAPARRK